MNTKKKKDGLQVTETTEPIVVDSSDSESRLRANLEEIRDYDGVVGYILKNTTSASIDLKDPAKIVDYATLSSTIFDVTEELTTLFNLEDTKNTIINGNNLKIVSLNIGKNRVSIFLESNSDTDKVLEKIQMV
jgi:predicted regulator of Ras-like GTPase activity (Roadblock/LC7/MglB family)